MSNYLSGVVQSNFGDKRVVIANLVMDDGYASTVITGFEQINYVAINPKTAGEYTPRNSYSGGTLTLATATSASSYDVMIVGR